MDANTTMYGEEEDRSSVELTEQREVELDLGGERSFYWIVRKKGCIVSEEGQLIQDLLESSITG
eukprot:scaffold3780_cov66-Cyclotella_meneghiniana.AAC.2